MIHEVTSPDELRDLHAAVVVPSFPEDERATAQQTVDRVGRGVQQVLALRDEDGWLGCAIGDVLTPDRDVVLLSWLAVRPGARAAGTGSLLLAEALRAWHARPGRIVLGEMEPLDAPASAATGDPARRAGFYARHGARLLDVPYVMPPMQPGLPCVDMLLFVLPAPGQQIPAELPAAGIRAFLEAYVAPGTDREPARTAMLAALSGRTVRTLAILPAR